MKQNQGKTDKGLLSKGIFTIYNLLLYISLKTGGDEPDSVVYSKALEKIDFTELRSFQEEREQRRMQELEEVSLKIKVGSSVQF